MFDEFHYSRAASQSRSQVVLPSSQPLSPKNEDGCLCKLAFGNGWETDAWGKLIMQNTIEFHHSYVSFIRSRAKSTVVKRASSKQVIPVCAGHMASHSSWRLFCGSRPQPQTQIVEFQ